MSEAIIPCRDVRTGDFIRIGRLLFHVKHAELRGTDQGPRMLAQARRLGAGAPHQGTRCWRWFSWAPDTTVTRVTPLRDPADELGAEIARMVAA